jgi:hypothetical protein
MPPRRKKKIKELPTAEVELHDQFSFGTVIGIWADPLGTSAKYVLLNNNHENAPKGTFSIYKLLPTVNKGEWLLPHFIPYEVLCDIQKLVVATRKPRRRTKRK